MKFRHYILDPPDDLPEPEKRRWRESAKFHATLWIGEWFWDDALRKELPVRHTAEISKVRKKNKLSTLGRDMVGHDLICSTCEKEARIVSSEDGGICRECYNDKKNEEEEDFWTSIGCPD